MLSKMLDTLAVTRRRIHDLVAEWLPILNAEELTKASWAKPVRAYDQVPPNYHEFFEPLAAAGRPFPYTVLTPSYEGYMHPATEKLVCHLGEELYILEASGDGYNQVCYPLGKTNYVQIRSVLLDSSIKISGVTRQGDLATTAFRFNTATDYLFTPILKSMRLAAAGLKEPLQSSGVEQFDHWIRVSFKFMNYARRSLLGGEKVIHAVLQLEIRATVLRMLGRSYYRTVSPPHASILTGHELIVIREEQRSRGDEYGGVWTYIPVDKIVTMSLSWQDKNLLMLSIQLPGEEHIEYPFQASIEDEVNRLLREFQKLKTE